MIMFIRVLTFELALAAILFACAGTWQLPWFWALIAVNTTINCVGVAGMDKSLIHERLHPTEPGEDRHMRRLLFVILMAHLVIAGLDARWHWSVPIPISLRAVALIIYAAAMGFSIWTLVVNRFASSVVRIQEDRGHVLVITGPYRWVRHPGYAGMMISAPAGGVVLGSWWSLLPLFLMMIVIVRRVFMEERILGSALAGYAQYMQQVRWRMAPGVW